MHVSCLMPTYNRAKWIPLAIDCFVNQTFIGAELVILDNGTDNTESLIPQHPRIRYIRQPGPRLTTGAIRNVICSLAQGDVLIHWDDDDYSAPERIAVQLEQMKTSGKPFVGFHSISYWHTATRLAYQYRGTRPYACGTSQCYRKDYWQNNPFPTVQVGEDSGFSSKAKSMGLLESFDGTQIIVARAHDNNTWADRRKNLSWLQRVTLQDLPPAFLKAMAV